MALGWFDDLADANDYYVNERLETSAWDELIDVYRTKVVNAAYNRLYYHSLWTLPTYADATADELVVLKKANGEMAYYLALHMADEDRRKGLQAQGVTEAGIVKETYSENMLTTLPIPPIVIEMLEPFVDEGVHFGAIDLARDEEESVNTKVHEF